MKDTIKIFIVDDNQIYLNFLHQVLSQLNNIEVVGTAVSGRIALSKLRHIEVDLVLLDIEMPVMDGIEVLQDIRQKFPLVNVVMMSSFNSSQSDKVIKALDMGAIDFIQKDNIGDDNKNSVMSYQRRINVLASMLRSRKSVMRTASIFDGENFIKESGSKKEKKPEKLEVKNVCEIPFLKPKILPIRIDVVAIAASTGGPNALKEIIPRLPSNLNVPVLIVQHMPPFLTASLASSLGLNSSLTVKEAIESEEIIANTIYLAPGGKHLAVKQDPFQQSKRYISLNEDPPENSVRPAADILFRSLSKSYSPNILAVVLTGMGCDGTKGVAVLKEKNGCYCISQSKDTCVVYGMPRSVDEANLSDEKIPLDKIAERITAIIKGKYNFAPP